MNQPTRCVNCREPFELAYGFPGWLSKNRFPPSSDGSLPMYGGPLSVPQCKNCKADAYKDSRGWHVKREPKGEPVIFTLKLR